MLEIDAQTCFRESSHLCQRQSQGDFASIAKMKLEQAKTMFQKWEDIPTTLLLTWVWRCFYPQVENTTEK